MDFVGLAIEKKRKRVGSDFYHVGIDGLAVEQNSPAVRLAFKFHGAQLLAGCICELDLELHGRRSSCWRRPASFQREL
jgi:hypothetical protein